MWSYFEPDTTQKVEISTFDDGNQKYKTRFKINFKIENFNALNLTNKIP